MVKTRRNEFPADRITIMIDGEVDARLKMELAKLIMKCAKDRCKTPSTSYSRVLNSSLKESFMKEYDKKILKDAKPK